MIRGAPMVSECGPTGHCFYHCQDRGFPPQASSFLLNGKMRGLWSIAEKNSRKEESHAKAQRRKERNGKGRSD